MTAQTAAQRAQEQEIRRQPGRPYVSLEDDSDSPIWLREWRHVWVGFGKDEVDAPFVAMIPEEALAHRYIKANPVSMKNWLTVDVDINKKVKDTNGNIVYGKDGLPTYDGNRYALQVIEQAVMDGKMPMPNAVVVNPHSRNALVIYVVADPFDTSNKRAMWMYRRILNALACSVEGGDHNHVNDTIRSPAFEGHETEFWRDAPYSQDEIRGATGLTPSGRATLRLREHYARIDAIERGQKRIKVAAAPLRHISRAVDTEMWDDMRDRAYSAFSRSADDKQFAETVLAIAEGAWDRHYEDEPRDMDYIEAAAQRCSAWICAHFVRLHLSSNSATLSRENRARAHRRWAIARRDIGREGISVMQSAIAFRRWDRARHEQAVVMLSNGKSISEVARVTNLSEGHLRKVRAKETDVIAKRLTARAELEARVVAALVSKPHWSYADIARFSETSKSAVERIVTKHTL